MSQFLTIFILALMIIIQHLFWDTRYRTLHSKKNGLESQIEAVRASEIRFIEQNRKLEKQIKYQTGGFISENSLKHHLNNIQHQSFLHAKYDDNLSVESIEQSKKIILDKFVIKDNTEKKEPDPPKAPEPRFIYDESVRQAEKELDRKEKENNIPPRNTRPSITKLKY